MKLMHTLVAAATLLAPLPAIAADYVMKFSVSHSQRADHYLYTPVEVFGKELERLSEGRIDVQIYWGGSLGKISNVLGMLQGGLVEGVLAADGQLASYSKDVQVLAVPYLFENREIARNVLGGEFGTYLSDRIASETGIRPLGFMENGGYRHYSSNSPITSAADMEGLKIRTMNNPVHMEIVRALGASPTPIAWGDLYTSLQTGVVDGQENALSTFRIPKLEEVQKHIILDGHVYGVVMLNVSEQFYKSLPEDLQDAVDEAAAIALELNHEMSIASEISDRKYLEEYGVSIVDVSAEEKAIFREKTQKPVLTKLEELGVDMDLLESLFEAISTAEASM